MITFNEEERVTPTVARRRIATVQREMKSNKERTEALKLTYQRDKEIFNLSEVNLTSSERIDHSLERQLYRLKEIEKEVKRKSTQQIITDHAVVQFIERVMNFNVQDIRDKIKGLDSTRIKNMEDGSIDREPSRAGRRNILIHPFHVLFCIMVYILIIMLHKYLLECCSIYYWA